MTTLNLATPGETRAASVLLVEDDPHIREGVADLLSFSCEQFEIDVLQAEHGADALEQLRSSTPDLIISDVAMPIMDGYELLSNVRGNAKLAHIPIILLTAQASKNQINRGLSEGVELYLTKPFDSQELIDLVEVQLGKSLQEQSVRESRESQMRRDLSRTLQHELRTPLALVTAYLEFIDLSLGTEFGQSELTISQPDPDELQEYLRGIDVGITRLMRLVSDIIAALDIRSGRAVARIRAGATWLDDVEAMLTEALDEARKHEEHATADVELVIPDELGLIFGQRAYLKDAFVRLFSNALKFTKLKGRDGKLTVTASRMDRHSAELVFEQSLQGADGAIQIEFKDNGIGFPNHARYQLTELFYQHDRERWEQQGPGVGLAIVNGIVNAHNGHLQLHGQPDEGASVKLLLPSYPTSESQPELGTMPPAKRTVTVLLVEDDFMVRDVFIDLVEVMSTDFHYDIVVADHGQHALDLLETLVPDLIVSDVRMPVMDGLEMLSKIRQNPNLIEIPVIFLTGNRRPEQVHEGRKLGVDEYIAKPYQPEYLLMRMSTLLKRNFEKQSAESNTFNVLKERVLSSIEVGIVSSLTAMSQHSQTMRALISHDAAESADVDGLRHSLVGIQQNSSMISGMVRKATMLVDIRTGAAAAAFKVRANMIESVHDMLAATLRDFLRSPEALSVNSAHGPLAITLESDGMQPPIYGNLKMLGVAFTHLFAFLAERRVSDDSVVMKTMTDGDGVMVSAEFSTALLNDDDLTHLQHALANSQPYDASKADLVIFCEYIRLHSAELTGHESAGKQTICIKFAPYNFELHI